jgi:hypothetical protein
MITEITDKDELAPSDLRRQCDALVHSGSIDKESALGIQRLHHEMELLVLQERMSKEVDRLNHELSTLDRTRRFSDMLTSLTEDIRKVHARLTTLEESVKTTAADLLELASLVPKKK